ncbi:MAG: hypothetical protein SNJ58_09170 [Aggregatilineales bacterium]
MNLSWTALAVAFQAVGAEQPPLEAALCAHAAEICARHAEATPLDFDEQALIDLLTAAWSARTFEDATQAVACYLEALRTAVQSEAPEAAGLGRFYEEDGFKAEWDIPVLRQMVGGVCLKPPLALIERLRTG